MLHNDISNNRSCIIGFRCENSLLKYKDDSIPDRLFNVFKGRTHRAEVSLPVFSLMNHLYWNTEYTVMLIIDEKNYTAEAERFLSDYPFNGVLNVLKSVSEITMMLNTGELTYYVSEDIIDRQRVNSRYAVSLEQFNEIFRRKVLRP